MYSIKKVLKISAILLPALLLLGALFFYVFVFFVKQGAFGEIYSSEEIAAFKHNNASRVYSSDGVVIGRFYRENRITVDFKKVPRHVTEALVAAEDARYYEHEGVDTRSLFRVLIRSIILGDRRSGGGSTISQQLVKNMYGREPGGIFRLLLNKTKEAILAQRLEELYSKEDILNLYLNLVPFGENMYGIETSSLRFFNKHTEDLKIEEGAVLVGMLKANSYYNPRLYPEHSLQRRNTVMQKMAEHGYLTETEYDSLSRLPIELFYTQAEGIADYFLVQVRSQAEGIIAKLNAEQGTDWSLERDGLEIKTTLDHQLQSAGIKAFKSHLSSMQKLLRKQYSGGYSSQVLNKLVAAQLSRKGQTHRAGEYRKQELFDWDGYYTDSISVADSIREALTLLHAGMLAVDPQNGAVRCYIGGIDFRSQPYDQIRAQRQLASIFKPVVYACALEDGYSPCHMLDNDSFVITDHGAWNPRNYDGRYGGKYSFAGALTKSMNVPTVNLFFSLGYEKVNSFFKNMGFSENMEEKPASALGVVNGSIAETTMAYAAFANGGQLLSMEMITSISTADGKILYKNPMDQSGRRIMDKTTADLMNRMLQKVINEGTGQNCRKIYGLKIPLAGKTGTSQNFSDAWFVAYNPKLVCLSRVGASLPSIHFNHSLGSGGKLALPLVAKTLAPLQFRSGIYGKFEEADKALLARLDCPDYREDYPVEQFMDRFRKKELSAEEKEEIMQRKKKRQNFFDRFRKK